MLQIPALIMAVYAVISLMLPWPVKWPYKILGSGVIFLCALKYHFYSRLGGIMSPDLPVWMIIAMEAAFGTLLIGVFCCLIKDLVFFALFILRKAGVCSIVLNRLYVHLAIIIFAVLSGTYGTLLQLMTPKITYETVKIENLDSDFDGFKIVQLSDLHIGPILKGNFLSKVTAAVNQENPDLVVITGDFVDGRVDALKQEFPPLKDIKAPFGILAVTGNHEYYSGSGAWIRALSEYNVRFLQNEHVNLHKGKGTLTVGGINDGRSYSSELSKVFADSGDHAKIFLAHKPRDGVKAKEADLILTGHTHGGTMAFLKPLIARYNDGYVAGRYDLPGQVLYVNNGTGIWSGFSCRFFVPPEITVFKLTRAS